MRALDKLDKFGLEGVEMLLGAGRKDESGDFTKGAGLGRDEINFVLNFIAARAFGHASRIGSDDHGFFELIFCWC